MADQQSHTLTPIWPHPPGVTCQIYLLWALIRIKHDTVQLLSYRYLILNCFPCTAIEYNACGGYTCMFTCLLCYTACWGLISIGWAYDDKRFEPRHWVGIWWQKVWTSVMWQPSTQHNRQHYHSIMELHTNTSLSRIFKLMSPKGKILLQENHNNSNHSTGKHTIVRIVCVWPVHKVPSTGSVSTGKKVTFLKH